MQHLHACSYPPPPPPAGRFAFTCMSDWDKWRRAISNLIGHHLVLDDVADPNFTPSCLLMSCLSSAQQLDMLADSVHCMTGQYILSQFSIQSLAEQHLHSWDAKTKMLFCKPSAEVVLLSWLLPCRPSARWRRAHPNLIHRPGDAKRGLNSSSY